MSWTRMPDDEPYESSPGLIVFTEAYLLQRGYCCGCGCLHCPYEYKEVSNPVRRKQLLEAKALRDARPVDPEPVPHDNKGRS